MREIGRANPRGLVLAWRRWQLWAGVGVVALGAVAMGGDVELGAGAGGRPTAQVARDELGAPAWSIARVGGSRLAASTIGGDVWLKDLSSGRMRRLNETRGGFTPSLAASPDGRILAVAGGRPEVRLWDAIDGGPRGAPPGAAGPATAPAFSPDGTLLAIAQGGGRGSVWEVATRREVGAVQGPSGRAQAIEFAGDGRQLATGGIDGSVRFWDLARVLVVGP